MMGCSTSGSSYLTVESPSRANETSQDKRMSYAEPNIQIEVLTGSGSIRLEYFVTNLLDSPIYIFDRLYDAKKSGLSQDWAYVSFQNGIASICRQVWPLPPGLHHDSPEVPYARLLAPGAKANAQFVLDLPLGERDPYYGMRHADSKTNQVKLSSIVLRIGWARLADLRGGSTVELNGEELVLFPYSEAIAKQKFTDSSPARLSFSGVAAK
jgi:hypothetical protein